MLKMHKKHKILIGVCLHGNKEIWNRTLKMCTDRENEESHNKHSWMWQKWCGASSGEIKSQTLTNIK